MKHLLELESDERDMCVRVSDKEVTVTMLGHQWVVICSGLQHDPELISPNTGDPIEGHDIFARTPAACPGCAEFVKEQG